jgi:hypothetical protein
MLGALKALLALGSGDTSSGVVARSTRHSWPLYGAKKLAKMKLTTVLDNDTL